MTSSQHTVVLGSGSGLGTYVPALLLQRYLASQGVPAGVAVFESLLPPEQHAQLDRTRRAYHERFDLALVGQKLAFANKLKPTADPAQLEALLRSWAERGVRRFIAVSGFWLAVLDQYARSYAPAGLDVTLCCLDATLSSSWRSFPANAAYRTLWLVSEESGSLRYQVPVLESAARADYEGRPRRVVAHGGGWGLGGYRDRIAELRRYGWELDVDVVYPEEAAEPCPGVRCFAIDPDWRPWQTDEAGEHTFPPLGELRGPATAYRSRPEHHEMFMLVSGARAVVSKPGGATLIDSLASGTPVVFLKSYGPSEAANAAVWRRSGLGISWDEWAQTGFSAEALVPLHTALAEARARIPCWPISAR
jgi:hypothetical protein